MDEKVRWKRYYRTTTVSQRRMLFEIWKETGNVSEACRRARVSRATFYYWKDRFEEASWAALEEPRSHAPVHPARKTCPEIVDRIVAMKEAHPKWGRQRIADELMKENEWCRVVSASTVRRVLVSRECAVHTEARPGERPISAVRHSENPGQTIHMDLCFVPATHEAIEDLPAVSGSSGKLKVCGPKAGNKERKWPGQVFGMPGISYEQAMEAYVNARGAEAAPGGPARLELGEEESLKVKRRELSRQEEALRIERRNARERRKVEDEAWRRMREQRREEKRARKQWEKEETKARRGRRKSEEKAWKEQRKLRKEQMKAREEEDRAWREQRNKIREQKEDLPVVTLWIAILVIVDSCTRRCFGLPMFTAGPHVTAEMVVSALEALLPLLTHESAERLRSSNWRETKKYFVSRLGWTGIGFFDSVTVRCFEVRKERGKALHMRGSDMVIHRDRGYGRDEVEEVCEADSGGNGLGEISSSSLRRIG